MKKLIGSLAIKSSILTIISSAILTQASIMHAGDDASYCSELSCWQKKSDCLLHSNCPGYAYTYEQAQQMRKKGINLLTGVVSAKGMVCPDQHSTSGTLCPTAEPNQFVFQADEDSPISFTVTHTHANKTRCCNPLKVFCGEGTRVSYREFPHHKNRVLVKYAKDREDIAYVASLNPLLKACYASEGTEGNN